MDPLAELAAASLAFVGTHFALSHPLRAPLVARIGEKGFLLLYSLVAFATLGWMILAFRAAPSADLPGSGDIGWIVATALTLPALVLFLGSLRAVIIPVVAIPISLVGALFIILRPALIYKAKASPLTYQQRYLLAVEKRITYY